MTIKLMLKQATALWKQNPRECMRLLREARQAAETPVEILAAESELLVYGEWHERVKAGLPFQHSMGSDDLGWRFTDVAQYTRAAGTVGGDQAGFAAFVAGTHKAAEKIWSQSTGIVRNFRCSLAAKDESAWAEVETLSPAPENCTLAWLGCDGKYFEAFGCLLLKTLVDHGTAAHVHLMDPTPDAIALVQRIAPAAGLTVEYPKAERIYYHAARFKRFADMMDRNGAAWFLDVDAICNRSLDEIAFTDIAMRLRPARIEPWNQFNACMIGVAPLGRPYMRAVADWLAACRETWFWGIDQLALYCVWRAMDDDRPKIHCLTEKECDYDYQPQGVVWCNSGGGKFTAAGQADPSRAAYYERFEAIRDKIKLAGAELHNSVDGTAPGLRIPLHPNSLEQARAWIESAAATAKITVLDKPPPFRKRRIGKFVYLPVEISGRELATKARLAGELAKRGFQVVIGASWNIGAQKFGDLPPGIVLFKTANALDAKIIWGAGCAGHLLAILNEELISLSPDERIYRYNCNRWALDMADAVFAHGEPQARLYRKLTSPSKVYVTGHPRSAERHGGLRGGDIVLCMNTASVNSAVDFTDYLRMAFEVMGEPPTADIIQMQQDAIAHEWKYRDALLEAARLLRTRFGARFKFRPHPAEWKGAYDEFADCLDQPGSFSERLRTAAVVVFASGCGTGIEAFNAGVPAVRLGQGGFGLSHKTGLEAATASEVMDRVLHLDGLAEVGTAGDLSGEFAPDSVAQAIETLWRKHSFPEMDFDLETAWRARKTPWQPGEWHENKFPVVSRGIVEGLVGMPVIPMGWNVFSVSAA